MMPTIWVSPSKLGDIGLVLEDAGQGIVDLSVAIEKLAEFSRDKVTDPALQMELNAIGLSCAGALHIISISNASVATIFLALFAKAKAE